MFWKIVTAVTAIVQLSLLLIGASSIAIWDRYSNSGIDRYWINDSFLITLPVTMIGLILLIASVTDKFRKLRIWALLASSALFLQYTLLANIWVFSEFSSPTIQLPFWDLLAGQAMLVREGELSWFALSRELSPLFLVLLVLGAFFLSREEKGLLLSQDAPGADCPSCGDSQEATNRFCTNCGITLGK